jgi:RNA polymerase sigma-70 factor, ECF subfamily
MHQSGGPPVRSKCFVGSYGRARALLDQYIAAFQNADAAALERLLTQDAAIEATPIRTWFAGRKTCVSFLRDRLLRSPGDRRMHA